jgi:drug/metabolite transporter (DMT)-like permease
VVVLSGAGTVGVGLGLLSGVAALLVAKAAYGYGYIYIRRRLPAQSPVQVAACSQLAAAAMLTPALATGRDPVTALAALTPLQGLCLILLGAVGTGAAQLLNYRNITALGPTTASLATYLIPPIGVAAGVLLLGEHLTTRLPLGAALILVGIYLARHRCPAACTDSSPAVALSEQRNEATASTAVSR